MKVFASLIGFYSTQLVSGCLIKESPSTYVGFPSTDGRPETTYYSCVSDLFNCDYEVHVIANYESVILAMELAERLYQETHMFV